jgi:hypothetical protein
LYTATALCKAFLELLTTYESPKQFARRAVKLDVAKACGKREVAAIQGLMSFEAFAGYL